MRVADKVLAGVTCIRLDATVTFAHSDKELAEPNFKGFGHHPLNAYCDNTGGEPLAGMLRKGSAGSNTAADHLHGHGRGDYRAAAGVPAAADGHRRRRRVQSRPVEHLDTLAARRGYPLIYSCGWELGERERAALAPGPRGPGRSRSITAARSASAAPTAPATTPAAGTGVLDRGSARHRADRAAAHGPGR